MRILFVTPRLSLPADTGAKIRTYNLLRAVAKNNTVGLLSFYFEENTRAIAELESLGIEVHLIKAQDKINFMRFISRLPLSIEKYRSGEMTNKLRELIASRKFELIHFDHPHMGQYIENADGLPCVLDEHNVEALILKRCSRMEKSYLKRRIFASQAKKMAVFEGGLAVNFSKCLTVSEDDKKALFKLSGGKADIEVIPNGVDTEYFQSTVHSPQPMENTLVFTGSMDWLPNSDAVLYFSREILPLIWEKDSKVKFYVVGKNPPEEVKRLGRQDPRIVVTGVVADVRPYMAAAQVFVVPLRIGGGTRLKILEAMAMQKAAISTALGAEGITYTADKNIVIKDRPQEFARAVISLLEDGARRDVIGCAGRELVCANYDWEIIGARLNNLYKTLINEK